MRDKRYDVDDVGFYVSGIQAVQANHTYLYRNMIWLPQYIITTSSPAEGIQSHIAQSFRTMHFVYILKFPNAQIGSADK